MGTNQKLDIRQQRQWLARADAQKKSNHLIKRIIAEKKIKDNSTQI